MVLFTQSSGASLHYFITFTEEREESYLPHFVGSASRAWRGSHDVGGGGGSFVPRGWLCKGYVIHS